MLIVQITDTHIKPHGRLAYRKVDTDAFLERAVAAINELDPAPDLVVVTGDLVDAGMPEEYERLRGFLDRLAFPVFVIPGNHDERGALADAFAAGRYLPAAGPLHYAIEDWPVRILALDTLIPGKESGALCADRLAWLADRLAEDRRKPTVLMMHHPPFGTGMTYHDDRRLEGRAGFAAIVQEFPQVGWILTGHLHRNMTANWHGVPASCVSSTAHQATLDLRPGAPLTFTMEPPAMFLLGWNDGNFYGHTHLIGDFDGPHPFFSGGKLIN